MSEAELVGFDPPQYAVGKISKELLEMRSWVPGADDSDFPIQNLPYGIFSTKAAPARRVGVAIGDQIVDLAAGAREGYFRGAVLGSDGTAARVFGADALNAFMALGADAWAEARAALQELLSVGCGTLRDAVKARARVLVPQAAAVMHLPAHIGDYTDFYSSREHATNLGTMFRDPARALNPNWLRMPIGYHGRASSIVVSGTPLVRPCGQVLPRGTPAATYDTVPDVCACRLLDFELEMGVFVGPGNTLGKPVPVADAHKHIFGMVLFNDWSARDIQKFEYVPLGPFTGKNCLSTVSPWVVTFAALEPFRCRAPTQDPAPAPYLTEAARDTAFDVSLSVSLQSARMTAPQVIARTSLRAMYWTITQQLAHHTITGCNMRPGDLYATGTLSGTDPRNYGSMIELSWKGTREITLASGETRKFLADGDTVTLAGVCTRPDLPFRIGFGTATGTVLPATALPILCPPAVPAGPADGAAADP